MTCRPADLTPVLRAGTNSWRDLIDAYVEAGLPEPTEQEVTVLFQRLPAPTQALAVAWGTGDTEFRDAVYVFLRDNQPETS